ncbi:DUF3486 family protein [Hydrogenophaga defluvii]|uniref:DUF3486 family protein n=1 Tax=Hydrogenophaga defluvii TaxID=249410 RepID=A0ABW2S940_9BURK
MGRKSTIARLPADVKTYIEGKLAEGKLTLAELLDDLRARFPAHDQAGDLPSRSAVHRYGQKLERRLSAIRASTEAAKLIQAQAGDNDDARSEALTALVQTELFEAILSLQEADDPDADPADRVAMLSSAAKNIATLTRSSVGLKKFQSEVRDRAQAAAASVEKIAKSGGLSGEAAEQIRREILGIAG